MSTLLAILIACTTMLSAPVTDTVNPEEEAVKQVIINLFDGMKNADPDMVKSAFTEDAIMKTIGRTQEGSMAVNSGSLEQFVAGISKAEPNLYNEKILDYEIHIDGNLASVWTPYEFYLGDKFSHCGANSFQMFKSEDGWKIIYIIDTRHREGCGQ